PLVMWRACKDRKIASVPLATPMAWRTPQYMANSFSKAARLGPLNNLMDEATRSHWWCSSFSMPWYFPVTSRSGIFLAYALTLTPDTESVTVILPVEFTVTVTATAYARERLSLEKLLPLTGKF